jgi:hypothetical protein
MEIRDQERDIIALHTHQHLQTVRTSSHTYLDRLPPQNKERFCALGQETCELMHQYMFYLICLLDLYAHTHAINTWFDEDLLVFVSRYRERVEKDFRRASGFDFGYIVSFGGLRCEV